ncbi:MAG TPA: radical SAM family heme chaperone HemW [Burkholderiaceae bacterium]|nr:radical SAM family heme chaperone HemW [Burkholderiaceae bacterium]
MSGVRRPPPAPAAGEHRVVFLDGQRARERVSPPLALYVHVPWCLRKCPYCDFNSHAIEPGTPVPEEAYLAALCADLESTLPTVWGRSVHSVFLGGGTPSLLSGAAVERLLSDVRARLRLSPDCEITLEANPGTLEAGRYGQYRRAGVNRLSIGVQSFQDEKLRALGRVHDGAQALAALEAARREFANFNVDLMIGLPGQNEQEARTDVQRALQFEPPHLSIYRLTLEPNTVFHKYPPPLPEDETMEAIERGVEELLAGQGYEHYEVSAWARSGCIARHNMNYWTFGDYLGIGAGAHAKISLADRIVREERFRLPSVYLEHAARGQFVASTRDLEPEDLIFEFMLNALRLRQGFAPALFAQRTGLSLATIEPILQDAQAQGLLERTVERIRPSERGMRFLNDLQGLFLPAGAQVR